MAISNEHREFLAQQVANAIGRVVLVNGSDVEVSNRLNGDFVRNGTRAELQTDIEFDIAADSTVAGWRAFRDDAGETPLGGYDFETPETYNNDGVARLRAELTYYDYAPVT